VHEAFARVRSRRRSAPLPPDDTVEALSMFDRPTPIDPSTRPTTRSSEGSSSARSTSCRRPIARSSSCARWKVCRRRPPPNAWASARRS
jgi:hypothetical protein